MTIDPGPERRRDDARPLWTAFLTPLAVVIGAFIIAGAIWWTDDDPAPAVSTAAPVTDGGASSTSSTPNTSGQGDLLATFRGYASELGLDTAQFDACVRQQANVDLITAHLQEGQALGVTGTPTFFINNKMIVGAQPAAVFDEVIDRELAGSPATLDGYSAAIQQLAASGRFAIVDAPIALDGAPIEGNPDAKVMIAEFSDFQCPFCKRWSDENLARLRSRLGDDVAMAFLHFPITQIHPNAGNASMVAECANEQGKFWEMHDLLFARQLEWQNLRVQ